MTRHFIVPDETKDRQRRASSPAASAWVSANAGSGKTWVLARRVIRLLLAGNPASRILCLTFTKAAAATMSNRVFAELGKWVMLDDASLAKEIAEIEGEVPDAKRLAAARRLFAAAIETPGGLKIQTIHGFCESILQQFPLEADLGGKFDILDATVEAELVDAARSAVLVEASLAAPEAPLARAFATLLAEAGEFAALEALAAIIDARDDWLAWLRDAGTREAAFAQLAAALAVDPALDDSALAAEVLASPEISDAFAVRLLAAWEAGGKRDQDQAARLRTARALHAPQAERVEAWTALFLTQKGEAKAESTFASKGVAAALPEVYDRAGAEAARLKAIADRRAARATWAATVALLTLGDGVVADYERRKRARGALDFDDLVSRTADLLSRSDAAAWVQYKLDQGIDHVLVDEAQDTSPRQWRIVRGLTDEFFAGESARAKSRTIFAVGDEKQSIYSFQGAAPHEFSATRRAFQRKVEDAERRFDDIKLHLSFRSTRDVLAAVDLVFADDALRRSIIADPTDYTDHTAARGNAPGQVEIWPMVTADADERPEDWRSPIDTARASAPWEVLAHRIADEITRLIGSRLEGTGERVTAKDIIVLVRKRGPFVEAMNRVSKQRGLPVAGQDRLRLTDHIAVADLLALGRALTLPEDDLALAGVLKSPLFGLDDDDLAELARGDERPGESLTETLRRRGSERPHWREALRRLETWGDLAGRVPPYEFYMAVLATDGGRRRFLARLGSEADDVLDEFLALALAADRGPPASLTRFLEEVAVAAPEIKRELDETRDELRVMTVHGAKGLEAPIVFLVDPGAAPVHASHDPKLLALPVPGSPPGAAPALVWSRKPAPAIVVARRDAVRAEAAAEYRRLFYVAMTRAADRLYVCGHAPARGAHEDCWHAIVTRALTPTAEAVTDANGAVTALRWRAFPPEPLPAAPLPAAPDGQTVASTITSTLAPALPDWIGRSPPSVAAIRRLTPSAAVHALGGASRMPALDGRDRLAAIEDGDRDRRRGILIHRLLERLPGRPEGERAAAAERFLAARAIDFTPADRAAIADEVLAVLGEARFAAVFAESARAEAPIVGTLRDRHGATIEVSGRVDRLVLHGDEVWVVDFKSDRRTPGATAEADLPAAHVGQMALYRRLLARVFPGRTIRAFLLWTTVPALVEVPAARLAAAEEQLALT